jgi:hypothetical protein
MHPFSLANMSPCVMSKLTTIATLCLGHLHSVGPTTNLFETHGSRISETVILLEVEVLLPF